MRSSYLAFLRSYACVHISSQRHSQLTMTIFFALADDITMSGRRVVWTTILAPAWMKLMCLGLSCTRAFFFCLSRVSLISRSTWSCLHRYIHWDKASFDDRMWSRVALLPQSAHSAASASPHLWRLVGVGKTSYTALIRNWSWKNWYF